MTADDKTPTGGAAQGAGTSGQPDNQGEGNREAARHYNESQQEFVKAGKVEQAAENAKGQDPAEAAAAEQAGKARAKGFDPEENPDQHKSGKA